MNGLPAGNDLYARQSRRRAGWLTLGAIVATALIVLGATNAGFLQRLGFGGSPFTRASVAYEGEVTKAIGQPSPPATQAIAETPAPMPADVRAWLEHLERIERKRRSLAMDQISGLLVMATMIQGTGGTEEIIRGLLDPETAADASLEHTPATDVAAEAEQIQASWKALDAEFQSVPPPDECVPLRNSYSQTLGETGTMISEVYRAVGNSSEDPKGAVRALMGLRGKSDERVGEPASQSDSALAAICAKYNERKWFDIARDIGGGNMLQGVPMPSMPGVP